MSEDHQFGKQQDGSILPEEKLQKSLKGNADNFQEILQD